MNHLYLTEYKAILLPAEAIPASIGEEIHRRYGRYVEVTFPSPRTDGRWRLMAQGWIGHIPLSDGWQLTIDTKVPVDNLWQLLSWAYDWHSWRLFAGEVQSGSLPAFYDGLARFLAEEVLLLARRGLFGDYRSEVSRQEVVRGRIQLGATVRTPNEVGLVCAYDRYTVDNIYNQILALALHQIGRSGWCGAESGRWVKRARRVLPLPTPTGPIDWSALSYSRLNQPYRRLHLLCKFFLDGLLPSRQSGTDRAVPFLINMSLLYEQFVAAWLTARAPSGYRVRAQERVVLGGTDGNGRQIAIDIVIYNSSGEAVAVLDTKYKAPERPDMGDIYQVTFYAHQQRCTAAYLVYPADLPQPIAGTNRDVHYRNLTFALTGDIEANGRAFLQKVLPDG